MKYFIFTFVVIVGTFGFIDPATAQNLAGAAQCTGPTCSACNLLYLANAIIKWLIGFLCVLFAVLMAIAGWGLVVSGGNQSALDDAKSKFTNAIIGFLIVLSAWLVVDTIMRGLVQPGGLIEGDASGALFWSRVECQEQYRASAADPTTIDLDEMDEALVMAGGAGGDQLGGGNNFISSVPPQMSGRICYHTGVCLQSYTLDPNACRMPNGGRPIHFFRYEENIHQPISRSFTVSQLTTSRAACVVDGVRYAYLAPGAVERVDQVVEILSTRGKSVSYSTSGYRAPAYNSTLSGAAQNSYHMLGIAFDLVPGSGTSKNDIVTACRQAGARYAYSGSSFSHCDWGGIYR